MAATPIDGAVPADGRSGGVYGGSAMGERPLVLAIIDACLLLDLCRDDIDATRVASALDELTGHLTGLRHDDQVELRAQFDALAAASGDRAYAQFVSGLADRFRLAEPGPGAHRSWG